MYLQIKHIDSLPLDFVNRASNLSQCDGKDSAPQSSQEQQFVWLQTSW